MTWDDLDGGRAADASPGEDFTAIGFIIQQYFAGPRPGGRALPGRKFLPLEPLAEVFILPKFRQTIPGNLVEQAFQPVLIKD